MLEPIVTAGINTPMFVTSAPGNPNRLFVAERGGTIRIVDLATNTVQAAPFLSIPVSTDGERGLLGLAFDHDYASNGRFYVNYSAPAGSNVGDQIIARYTANCDPLTATSADPAEFRLLRLDRPSASTSNHNGGWIGFSPNNADNLYIAVGDGGGGDDTFNTAQNLNSPHGKILRIDVNHPAAGLNYGIPVGNPFAAGGGRAEIWAVGVRNPWRDSFDRQTGDLWIGDVGQSAKEEIDFQPANAPGGLNYGWSFREGDIAGPKPPPNPPPAVVNPVVALDRSQARSITGGYVYRGALEGLQGHYLFGDFITGRTWTLQYDGSTVTDFVERTGQLDPDGAGGFSWANRLASFGEDANGELYMVAIASPGGSGAIYRVAGVPTWNVDGTSRWSSTASWSPKVPNGVGARAILGDVITGDQTAVLDSAVTLGRLDFDSEHAYLISGENSMTFDATTGTAQINVVRGSHAISAPIVVNDPTQITVTPPNSQLKLGGGIQAAGATVTKAGPGTLILSNLNAAGLSVNAGKLAFTADVTAGPMVVGSLSIAGGSAPSGTLDLANRAIVIDYSGTSPVEAIRQHVIAGRGAVGIGSTWNGPGIASSSAAAANTSSPESTSIGYAENSTLPLGPYAEFRGQNLDATSIIVAYTRTGDANLDGVVNDDDVTIVSATYAPGVPQPSWALGDFDYNGFVDDGDVTLLGALYDPSATPLPSPPAAAAVPEPASILLAGVAVISGILFSKWRRRAVCLPRGVAEY
jgi:autotransporter-associated beta strand protein